jgi:hypothetical protein
MIRLTDAIDPDRRVQLVFLIDVARMFRTDSDTVGRWIREGTLKHSILDGYMCVGDHNLYEFILNNGLDPRKIVENLEREEKDRLPEVPYDEDPLAAFKLDKGRYLTSVETVDDNDITKVTIEDEEEACELTIIGRPDIKERLMKTLLARGVK